ncbi:MAG: response regulator transcription factor [Candidatus Cryptobacteroides sp.]
MKKKATILIAEDKSFLIEVIREAFGKDYDSICVQTEKELFGMLEKADAAVVGLDVCPGDQSQRIEMIRTVKSERDIPVIALTSIQYSAVRIELLRKGADDVMTKPFNPDELVARMENILSRYK